MLEKSFRLSGPFSLFGTALGTIGLAAFWVKPAMAQAASGLSGPVAFIIVILVALVIYLIPTIVAFRRRHPNRWIIGALNVALGGTGIVWLGCLVWACGAIHKSVEAGGSDGGESGLNVFANDVQKVELVDKTMAATDQVARLERLKQLLDTQAITKDEFDFLKAKVLAQADPRYSPAGS